MVEPKENAGSCSASSAPLPPSWSPTSLVSHASSLIAELNILCLWSPGVGLPTNLPSHANSAAMPSFSEHDRQATLASCSFNDRPYLRVLLTPWPLSRRGPFVLPGRGIFRTRPGGSLVIQTRIMRPVRSHRQQHCRLVEQEGRGMRGWQ